MLTRPPNRSGSITIALIAIVTRCGHSFCSIRFAAITFACSATKLHLSLKIAHYFGQFFASSAGSIKRHQTNKKTSTREAFLLVGGQVCAGAPHSAALRPHSSLFLAHTSPSSGAKPASPVQSSDTKPIKKPPQGRLFYWWVWLGSNQRPLRCQRSAHTTELHTRHRWLFLFTLSFCFWQAFLDLFVILFVKMLYNNFQHIIIATKFVTNFY